MNLILKEISKKNEQVFKTFFDKHYAELVIVANGYLFDQDASEDLVQEIFIYIWEHADRLKIETSLKGYLYTMTRNRSLNYLKSLKITDDLSILELNINLITEHVFDSSLEEDKEKVYQQILKIVDSLPENMQKIVKLKFLQNYKYLDIANEMGISVNTVKTQLKRAKSKIIDMVTILFILLQMKR